MSLPAQQYLAMRAMLRGALSGNYPGAANPSEQDVLGFFAQLFIDSSGATASNTTAMASAARGVLSGNFSSVANPNDADVVAFWTQLSVDSSGATQLSAQRYLAFRAVLRDSFSINYPGAANPSDADVLSYFSAYGTPAALLFANGAVAWWDSDYSGGVPDGSTAPAPVNRIVGSNAVLALGTGGTTVTYKASAWRGQRTQSCWHMFNKSFRATGSDIVNAANGLGKSWTVIEILVPRYAVNNSPGSVQYGCGWDNFAAATFSNSCGIQRTDNTRFTWGVFQTPATETVDTQVWNQNAQVLEVSRPNGNQIQFGVNNVRTSAVSWGSAVTFNVDGFSVGGWAGSSTGNAAGDAYVRAIMVWNKILNTTDRDAVYAYIRATYSGFENMASMGAT